ncbi:hypothetical protein HDV00_004431 [Rhizophlyctis rosea]|nr:hypothetical protein HDV00_004431 [Rhizophlyctis rosea]
MAPGAPDMDRSSSDGGDGKNDDSDFEERKRKDVQKPVSPITPVELTPSSASAKQDGFFAQTSSQPMYVAPPVISVAQSLPTHPTMLPGSPSTSNPLIHRRASLVTPTPAPPVPIPHSNSTPVSSRRPSTVSSPIAISGSRRRSRSGPLRASFPHSQSPPSLGSLDVSTPGGGKTYQCETCGKIYKHPNCLSKHRWEHTEHWKEAAKFSLSKHQQVQLLEAASILVGFGNGGWDGTPGSPIGSGLSQSLGSGGGRGGRDRRPSMAVSLPDVGEEMSIDEAEEFDRVDEVNGKGVGVAAAAEAGRTAGDVSVQA